MPLPQRSDFIPNEGDLDQEHAFTCFGGLTLDAAFERFLANPMHHQEDFMFMGPKAFAYYQPVLFRYLMAVDPQPDDDDHESWIIARACIAQHRRLLSHGLTLVIAEITSRISDYLPRLATWPIDDDEKRRARTAWEEALALYRAPEPDS